MSVVDAQRFFAKSGRELVCPYTSEKAGCHKLTCNNVPVG